MHVSFLLHRGGPHTRGRKHTSDAWYTSSCMIGRNPLKALSQGGLGLKLHLKPTSLRVCLGSAYFAEIENFLLKVL